MDPGGRPALLTDLKDPRPPRQHALVYWFSEFGRTPNVGGGGNGDGGPRPLPAGLLRRHGRRGVKGGRVIGATDPDGVMVTERPVQVTDLHATVCHSLGIDDPFVFDKRQYFAGRRPMRIVEKGGVPVREVFA